jgi:hypothetical protein
MDDIRSGIEGLAARVGRLIPGTEEQFLFIGSRLNKVYTEVEKISRQASSLVSMLDSSVMKGTIGRFREILQRMDRHIGGSDSRFASGMAALNDVLAAVSRVGDPLANFRKIVKTLKILAISTKIESAQLKKMESDFVNLAGDVEQLSALIHDKSAGIESHRRSLMSLTEETLTRIVSINEKSRGYISEVLGNIRSSIELLESRHDLSFSAADSMLGRFNATSKQVGEVVMSMQFHDITRQQVEHIRDVLTSMEGRLHVSPRGADDDRADVGPVTAELVAEAAIACELQKASSPMPRKSSSMRWMPSSRTCRAWSRMSSGYSTISRRSPVERTSSQAPSCPTSNRGQRPSSAGLKTRAGRRASSSMPWENSLPPYPRSPVSLTTSRR